MEEGLGDTFLIGDVDPARLLEAWHAAHGAMPATGCWPVFALPGDLDHEPDAAELADLDRAARTLDPWSVYKRHSDGEIQEGEDVESYVRTFRGPGMIAPALQRLTLPTTSTVLQRSTYDTLIADPQLASRAFSGSGNLPANRWLSVAACSANSGNSRSLLLRATHGSCTTAPDQRFIAHWTGSG
ncbi:hypothetical protein ABZ388_11680 [Micromonospora parva]|uniref:hypothetical protein n=1 Tax=Micromonospora parva TaxID=1464048 RepID=UPI0033F490A6